MNEPLPAAGATDAPSVEWYNQPSNQTDAPRTTAMSSGDAGPMLDSGTVLDTLWGGKKGTPTDVGDQYDVPQVRKRQITMPYDDNTLTSAAVLTSTRVLGTS